MDGYTFVNEGGTRGSDAHKMSVGVRLGVYKGGDRIATMTPSVNVYRAQAQRSTEVAIDTGPARDLYVVLAGLTPDGLARFSVFVNPLVVWLWVAGVLVALGGLVAVWPPPRPLREPAPAEPAAPGAPGPDAAATAARVIIAVVLVVILTLGVACAVAWPLVRGRDGAASEPRPGTEDEERARELRETLDRSLAAIKRDRVRPPLGPPLRRGLRRTRRAERARAVELIRRLDELGER